MRYLCQSFGLGGTVAVSSPDEAISKSSIELSGLQNRGKVLVRKSVLVHSPCSRNRGRLG